MHSHAYAHKLNSPFSDALSSTASLVLCHRAVDRLCTLSYLWKKIYFTTLSDLTPLACYLITELAEGGGVASLSDSNRVTSVTSLLPSLHAEIPGIT